MAFYELRQYHVLPGKMASWVKMMEEEIIPFQVAKGMVVTGSFSGETDDSVFVWMRRFNSEAEREALYKAVYESEDPENESYWTDDGRQKNKELQIRFRALRKATLEAVEAYSANKGYVAFCGWPIEYDGS